MYQEPKHGDEQPMNIAGIMFNALDTILTKCDDRIRETTLVSAGLIAK